VDYVNKHEQKTFTLDHSVIELLFEFSFARLAPSRWHDCLPNR